jgi:hypothetical protein
MPNAAISAIASKVAAKSGAMVPPKFGGQALYVLAAFGRFAKKAWWRGGEEQVPCLGAAVKKEIEGGEVGQEVAPELGIDRRDILEGAQFNAVAGEQPGIEVFLGLALDQKGPGSQSPAGLHQELGAPALHSQLGEQDQLCGQTKLFHKITDDGQVEIQKPFMAPGEGLRQEGEMLRQIGGVSVGGFKAFQVLAGPAALIADAHLADALQPQALLPHRDGEPQGALVVLEAVAGHPGGAPGKLHFVQDDQDVGARRLSQKAGKGTKIGLVGRDDHGSLTATLPAARCRKPDRRRR